MEDILRIKNLNISFEGRKRVTAVRGVSLTIHSGEIYALIGESGCGKSVTAQSILKLNPTPPAIVSADELKLGGIDVLLATERELESVRGKMAGMIFQDPLTSLNPTMKIGKQITERLYRREGLPLADCKEEAIRLLELVQVTDVRLRLEQYPHEFSGGMRQRAMIAMALAGKPKLLIADEATTALDVTTQLQILRLIAKIQSETNMAVLLITHDFGVVANLADRVGVMYAGRIVEEGEVDKLFHSAKHPYTRSLIESFSVSQGAYLSEETREATFTHEISEQGCPYAERCSKRMNICLREMPPSFDMGEGHSASCWTLHEGFPREAHNE